MAIFIVIALIYTVINVIAIVISFILGFTAPGDPIFGGLENVGYIIIAIVLIFLTPLIFSAIFAIYIMVKGFIRINIKAKIAVIFCLLLFILGVEFVKHNYVQIVSVTSERPSSIKDAMAGRAEYGRFTIYHNKVYYSKKLFDYMSFDEIHSTDLNGSNDKTISKQIDDILSFQFVYNSVIYCTYVDFDINTGEFKIKNMKYEYYPETLKDGYVYATVYDYKNSEQWLQKIDLIENKVTSQQKIYYDLYNSDYIDFENMCIYRRHKRGSYYLYKIMRLY